MHKYQEWLQFNIFSKARKNLWIETWQIYVFPFSNLHIAKGGQEKFLSVAIFFIYFSNLKDEMKVVKSLCPLLPHTMSYKCFHLKAYILSYISYLGIFISFLHKSLRPMHHIQPPPPTPLTTANEGTTLINAWAIVSKIRVP